MRIAILTDFSWLKMYHSLCSCVVDQALVLTKYGHEVDLFVAKDFLEMDSDCPPEIFKYLKKVIPKKKLIDYGVDGKYPTSEYLTKEHKTLVNQIAKVLLEYLSQYDIVFTHDWIFTGWMLPYSLALKKVADDTKQQKFFHHIHSMPINRKDWWSLELYGRNHRLVYPNKMDAEFVANQFLTDPEHIIHIPHIKDLRTFHEFDEKTCKIIDKYPFLLSATFVQVYPASTDRLEAKRLREVILLFSRIKKDGHTVCLLVANQHATGLQRAEDVDHYIKVARRNGLKVGEEFIMTSEYEEGPEDEEVKPYKSGLPRKVLRELMMLGNVFIFPTIAESFGLVLPEASLMSGCMPVLNKSLRMMLEVAGFRGLYLNFGAWDSKVNWESEKDYFDYAASLIIERFFADGSLQAKTWFRQRYNMDAVYHRHYKPAFAGASLWC